jgi:hypothetical protein
MYLGLFLCPWVLVFALSSLAMNHRLHQRAGYRPAEEHAYRRTFEPGTDPHRIATSVLADLGLVGPYWIDRRRSDARQVTVLFDSPLRAARITYRRDAGRVRVERRELRPGSALVSLHRGGFDSTFPAHRLWGLAVDALAGSMLFWVLSGLFMWWQVKPARRWGFLGLAVGAGVFGTIVAFL